MSMCGMERTVKRQGVIFGGSESRPIIRLERISIAFWLETPKFSLLVNSRAAWEEAVKKNGGDKASLLAMKSNRQTCRHADFGAGDLYTSFPTLGEWAAQNGIKL